MNVKDSNPKDAVGTAKPPLSVLPLTVLAEAGVAMMEGARKYRRHNYRVIGVRASIYVDALFRHISKWWEGEDIDADSGLSHVTKAIATLIVLRDAMIQGKLNDDRPPKAPAGFFKQLEEQCKAVIAKYPESLEAYTEKDSANHACDLIVESLKAAREPKICSKCGNSYIGYQHHICFFFPPELLEPATTELCTECGNMKEKSDMCHHCGKCHDCCKEL